MKQIIVSIPYRKTKNIYAVHPRPSGSEVSIPYRKTKNEFTKRTGKKVRRRFPSLIGRLKTSAGTGGVDMAKHVSIPYRKTKNEVT